MIPHHPCLYCRPPGAPPPRIMLVGADVSHPTNLPPEGVADAVAAAAASQPHMMPSVGAVVASVNA